MKVISVIIINGKEIDFDSLKTKKKVEIANELNRRALGALGYQPVQKTKEKTAWGGDRLDKHYRWREAVWRNEKNKIISFAACRSDSFYFGSDEAGYERMLAQSIWERKRLWYM